MVGELLEQNFKDKHSNSDVQKVLAMNWLAREDCFTFIGMSIPDGHY